MFLLIVGTLLVVLGSLTVINRYFSFKLHKNTFPLTLSILTLNMILLLSTDFLLPLDIFHAAIWSNNNEQPLPPGNETVSFQNNYSNSTNQDFLRRSVQLLYIRDNIDDISAKRSQYFKITWLLIYWVQFALCWFIFPVLMSYVSLKYAVPHFELRERFVKAIYQNIKFYLLCLVGIIIGLIYLVSSTGHGLNDFKPLLISLAHLYSLSYTLILLASGLIILPRDLLKIIQVPNSDNMNSLYVELSKTNDDLNDAQLNMIDIAGTILNSDEADNGDIIFNQMLNDCKLEVQSLLAQSKVSTSSILPKSSSNSSITSLDRLNTSYNKFLTHYYNFVYYQNHSNSIIHILAQTSTTSLNYIRTILIVMLGVVSLFLSCLIIFLEIIPSKWGHGWIFLGSKWYNFWLVLTILSYNTVSSLYALSKFKFHDFHLVANGESNPLNVLYYSLYSSRLLFPLCFNLMTLIPNSIQSDNNDKSIFEVTLYHDLTLIPLVKYLNQYLPIVIMILVALSYKYDIKQKVLLKMLGEEYYYQFFGMMMYEPETNEASEERTRMNEDYEYSLQDGKYLFERASTNIDLGSAVPNSSSNHTNAQPSTNFFSYL